MSSNWGLIEIWKHDDVLKIYPDCDKLFQYIPTHYKHILGDTVYHHCYSYTINVWAGVLISWTTSVFPTKKKLDRKTEARLSRFIDWLDKNRTAVWEVHKNR
ncbi:MAG TPA: hypothetical protein ENH85_07665 [Candidatus Scalindua sp.]|nr:hypothetical protein [Candidatus Scalindua sp.]